MYSLLNGSHRAFTNVPVPPSSAGEVPRRPARHLLRYTLNYSLTIGNIAKGELPLHPNP